jgi:aldose 1-epimerase
MLKPSLSLLSIVFSFLFFYENVKSSPPSVTSAPFGVHNGTSVRLYTLTNSLNSVIRISTYGGIITSIITKDRYGNLGDVVLGFDNLSDYEKKSPYFGALIGRYANRIAKGKFTLNGKQYQLPINNPPNSLHGGNIGYDKRVWTVDKVIVEKDRAGIQLSYFSPDGEEGYPGNVKITVIYTINNNNELTIEYRASTDQDTIINLTNHSYFNLAAGKAPNVLDHRLQIVADQYTVVDNTAIPTGEQRSVLHTPFNFKYDNETIGARIGQVPGGYDHNFVLGSLSSVRKVATVSENVSGRVMEVFTDQPGVQFYSGNFLDGSLVGKYGIKYVKHYGLCLETQHYPDSPNHPDFPSTILRPKSDFTTKTIYKFSTMDPQ